MMILTFFTDYISVPFLVAALLFPEILKGLFPAFFAKLPGRWLVVVVLCTSLLIGFLNVLAWHLIHGAEGSYELGEKIVVTWFCLSTFYTYCFKHISALISGIFNKMIGRVKQESLTPDPHEQA
jgi:hypothetical protein